MFSHKSALGIGKQEVRRYCEVLEILVSRK